LIALAEVGRIAANVAMSVLPLVVLFMAFQAALLRLPRREVVRVLQGTAIAAAGLFLFLLGVGIGFLPFGRAIGEALGRLPNDFLLVAAGLVLGFVTTWGEPAVRVLADQVQEASSGSVRQSMVLFAIAAGVAGATAIGLLRIAHEIPLTWILVPGYGIVIVLVALADRDFVAIAADSGGVATGPLANTFLLALALGAASAMGRDPFVHGLGLVSLIALAPLVSVMALGLVIRWKNRPKKEPSA
jgi:hypothetical protein